MNINELMACANSMNAKGTNANRKDVRLTALRNGRSVSVAIYEEGTARFTMAESWTPIWVAETRRLYIVYGLTNRGIKVQHRTDA